MYNKYVLYRITYIQNGQSPEVTIIYDRYYDKSVAGSSLSITDDGWHIVSQVSISDFNNDPSQYLQQYSYYGGDGYYAVEYSHDVVVFGFWDCNASKDLSTSAKSWIKEYLDYGYGAIFGHDTITAQGCGDHTNFNSLASYVNLVVGSRSYNASTKVQITKEGVFTTYPYSIGNVGTYLTIPATHVYGQTANGDIWLKLDGDQVTDNRNFYLTTYKNRASQ